MTIRGSCLCGGVTFEVDRVPGPMEICHCNRCRKVSGGASLVAIGVAVKDFRLLTGKELIKSYAAPILYQPPAYRTFFCSNCGSPVPDPEPEGEWFEIAAGVLDDDPGIRPDKHIFVELTPAWDTLADNLPKYTLPELHKLRTGESLPSGFILRRHRRP